MKIDEIYIIYGSVGAVAFIFLLLIYFLYQKSKTNKELNQYNNMLQSRISALEVEIGTLQENVKFLKSVEEKFEELSDEYKNLELAYSDTKAHNLRLDTLVKEKDKNLNQLKE
ncbi:MAG: hypothetical protein GXO12_06900, partial [Epsilonproteobacteria bacterium]|nr:hypothetical protein [Campylobacterota bacterium]